MMTWLIRFFFKWLTPFLIWIEPSFTGNDNRTSGKKISGFVLMFLIVSTTSKILMKENPTIIHIYLLCVLLVGFLALQGIITGQNIVDLWKNGKDKNPPPSDPPAPAN